MKTLTTSIVLGLALVAGSASAASFGYGDSTNSSVQQSHFADNTNIVNTQQTGSDVFADSGVFNPNINYSR